MVFLLFNSQLVRAQEAQVDATNFYDYFKGNEGGVQLFPSDLSNGEITLTPDEQNKVGRVTLKKQNWVGSSLCVERTRRNWQ